MCQGGGNGFQVAQEVWTPFGLEGIHSPVEGGLSRKIVRLFRKRTLNSSVKW